MFENTTLTLKLCEMIFIDKTPWFISPKRPGVGDSDTGR